MSWIKKHKEGGASPSSLLLLPVVLLVLGSGISGLLMEEQEPITVDEGYGEIEAIVPPQPENTDLDYNTTSVSYINDKNNSLKLRVEIDDWYSSDDSYSGQIYISVKSNLESSFDPEVLKIKARNINATNINRNYIDFLRSYGDFVGLERWPASQVNGGVAGEGSCFDGFDIKSNDFQANNITIWNEYVLTEEYGQLESPITIEITAVMKGLSKDVESTVQVTFVQEEIG